MNIFKRKLTDSQQREQNLFDEQTKLVAEKALSGFNKIIVATADEINLKDFENKELQQLFFARCFTETHTLFWQATTEAFCESVTQNNFFRKIHAEKFNKAIGKEKEKISKLAKKQEISMRRALTKSTYKMQGFK